MMRREVRPRFEIRRHENARELLERIAARLRTSDCPLTGYVAENRVVMCVPSARQRLWSAELRVDVVRHGDCTVIEGMYVPHPHVWVTYVILLAAVVVGVVVVGVFAVAEWSMNEPPVALYALPPLLVVGALAYAGAFIGQGFASEEMDELRAFLDEAMMPEPAVASYIRSLKPGDGSSSRRMG